jgi:signal transduction histidine kinase
LSSPFLLLSFFAFLQFLSITNQAKAEEAILNLSKEREARANAEASAAEERRKEAVEEKRQQELLIDVTSHEIRNPVGSSPPPPSTLPSD